MPILNDGFRVWGCQTIITVGLHSVAVGINLTAATLAVRTVTQQSLSKRLVAQRTSVTLTATNAIATQAAAAAAALRRQIVCYVSIASSRRFSFAVSFSFNLSKRQQLARPKIVCS